MSGALTIDLDATSTLPSYALDPIQDPRWARLVANHLRGSIFHSVGWLKALQETYQYTPLVLTTSPPGEELKNGLVFCGVESRLTGRRLVSLPFSDHCEPLCESSLDVEVLLRTLRSVTDIQKWKYTELRPVNADFAQTGHESGFVACAEHFLHTLDLRPGLTEIFHGLDKDSVQRRIQRAERAGLIEKSGRSDDLVEDFYHLFVMTRGRQHVPPSPRAWFRNLVDNLGDALEIRVAYKGKHAVAAILTLQFKDVVYYKYGCSDPRFNNLGATPWLFWLAITSAKSKNANIFDLGRTERDNQGLLQFKNHWSPQPRPLTYWRYPNSPPIDSSDDWKWKMAKKTFSLLPDRCLEIVGRLLYRHIG